MVTPATSAGHFFFPTQIARQQTFNTIKKITCIALSVLCLTTLPPGFNIALSLLFLYLGVSRSLEYRITPNPNNQRFNLFGLFNRGFTGGDPSFTSPPFTPSSYFPTNPSSLRAGLGGLRRNPFPRQPSHIPQTTPHVPTSGPRHTVGVGGIRRNLTARGPSPVFSGIETTEQAEYRAPLGTSRGGLSPIPEHTLRGDFWLRDVGAGFPPPSPSSGSRHGLGRSNTRGAAVFPSPGHALGARHHLPQQGRAASGEHAGGVTPGARHNLNQN